jgi:hypothetical protein
LSGASGDSARSSAGPARRLRLKAELIKPDVATGQLLPGFLLALCGRLFLDRLLFRLKPTFDDSARLVMVMLVAVVLALWL